jgi:hypothetical protein
MPLSIRKTNGQIIVTLPLGEALSLQVHRPLQVPFNIGAAMREAVWGLININAKKMLENFKPEVITSVIEDGNLVVTIDSQLPEELIYGRSE